MKILIVNVGSTTLKFRLFEMPAEREIMSGAIEGIGQPVSKFQYKVEGADSVSGEDEISGYLSAIQRIIKFLTKPDGGPLTSLDELHAVGFKTVFARGVYGPVELSEEVLQKMNKGIFFAPSHNPPYIEAIRTFREALPATPLIGLFEPAFHQTMPEYAWRYAIPDEWVEKYGLRRYGYHGASHRYISTRVSQMAPDASERIISCHLGGSSSICAIRDGKSIDTSMGMTPQSGVLHSTRPHDIDPFIPLYLIKHAGMTADEVVSGLSRESGLLALSGVSGEMRDVLAAVGEGNERARMAVDSFNYGVKKQIGAYVAALGGVDSLVFTGGIGERSGEIRAGICEGLACMGIAIDAEKNAAASPDCEIGAKGSPARVFVIATNEELVVARAAVEALGGKVS